MIAAEILPSHNSLRRPPDLHKALAERVRREDRSLNQQILYVLRQGVRRDGSGGSAPRPSYEMPPRPWSGPGLADLIS